MPTKFFRMRQTVSNEFQCKKVVLCQQQIAPLHTLLISSFLTYLPMKDHVKHQRWCFFSAKKAASQGLLYPFTAPISNNVLFEKLTNFYLWKSSKTHAILGEYRIPSAVVQKKLCFWTLFTQCTFCYQDIQITEI